MNKQFFSIILSGVLASGSVLANENVHWAYAGHTGPENWGNLAEKYATCSTGKNQSPINITGMVESDLPQLQINYKPGGNEVLNNGHAIQVNYTPNSIFSVGSQNFELKQIHFHTPSENIIEGTSYPMEAHFVHADQAGNLAVIGLMFKIGEYNAELDKAWKQMPHEEGERNELAAMLDAKALLPANHDYYRFNGSLTTPPCSEGVNWFVMKSIVTASKEQIGQFIHTMHHDTNRPVQPLNARVVLQ